jgi:hypothetical protein
MNTASLFGSAEAPVTIPYESWTVRTKRPKHQNQITFINSINIHPSAMPSNCTFNDIDFILPI